MDVRERITALAELMEEFRLAEARLEVDGVAVAFRKTPRPVVAAPALSVVTGDLAEPASHTYEEGPEEEEEAVAVESGTPLASPMSGIFYRSPSPGAPSFIKEGDEVQEGQIVGLIEAMKVFSEIPAPHAGVVTRFGAEAGQLVQPGDPLLWIK